MRSGQHNNKRSRGRSRRHSGGGSSSGGSGGGGGGNPINRVFESNGPEVKVRGTAQTVADKYLQLGRDAQVSGDNVMAENFYQHAEHYLRILAAAQAYNQQYQQQQQQYRRPGEETFDEDDGEERGDSEGGEGQAQPGDRPQYVQEQQPYQPASESAEQPPTDGRDQNQQPRSRDQGRGGRDRYRSNWDNRRDNEDKGRQSQPRSEAPPPASEVAQEAPAAPATTKEAWDGPQPSFLKRPTNGTGSSRSRKPRREAAENTEGQEAAPADQAPPVK